MLERYLSQFHQLLINVQLMAGSPFFWDMAPFITSRCFEITKWCHLGQGPQTNGILSYTCENLIKYSVSFSFFTISRAVCLTVTHAAFILEVRGSNSVILFVSPGFFLSFLFIPVTHEKQYRIDVRYTNF